MNQLYSHHNIYARTYPQKNCGHPVYNERSDATVLSQMKKTRRISNNPRRKLRCASHRSFLFVIIEEECSINSKGGYMQSTDQTIARLVQLVKETTPPVKMEGHVWYDVTNQGLEAEVKLLRLKGELAEHPLISTLVRFN